uniref:X8 domain-containing protein n=1 Tax=Oryza glaberrima TaxID=4538 RepID=I1PH34_ORYGL
MATSWSVAFTIFFSCILLLETISSSGQYPIFCFYFVSVASLDCSYGSAQVKILSSSVVSEQQNVYLFLKPFQSTRSCSARRLAGEFVNGVVVPNLRLNVTGVVVTANERQLGALRCTLESVQAELAVAGLGRSVKVSPELSLPSLRAMAKCRRRGEKHWRRVMEFVRRSGSFVVVEMGAEEKADLAVADVAAAFEEGVGVAFRISGRAARSAAEMARLIGDADKGRRWTGVLAEVASPSPRRELAAAARTTARDVFAPVTNPTTTPATNPVTVPATNPAMNPVTPGIVTVPSTNPATGYSNNPNLPPLYPEPTPVTMPDPTTTTTPTPFMNPVTAPTMPSPVTNPATTPAVTNPTTMPYPYPPQQGGVMPTTPTYQPPATMPAAGGQTWCVAKAGLMDAALQSGLDYACGMGGADCTAIQPMGACYNPNTLQAHASYAFNSYFQRNPSPASCDFGGAGMLVNINPSSGTCLFQASSAGYGAGYSPGVTGTVPVGGGAGAGAGVGVGVTPMGPAVGGTGGAGVTPMGPAVGGGSGSTVLNANSPGGNSMYGSDSNPTSLTGAAAAALSSGWVLCLVWIFTFAYVKEKV